MRCAAACFVCLTVLVTAMPLQAADTSYIGTWTLTEAVVAPWADAKQKPGTTETVASAVASSRYRSERAGVEA
jgi:hypothetical protein